MAKKSKKPRDVNALASAIVSEATGEKDQPEPSQQVQAGRLGGLKGGKARARKLSPERRSEIAKKAAATRWGRKA